MRGIIFTEKQLTETVAMFIGGSTFFYENIDIKKSDKMIQHAFNDFQEVKEYFENYERGHHPEFKQSVDGWAIHFMEKYLKKQ